MLSAKTKFEAAEMKTLFTFYKSVGEEELAKGVAKTLAGLCQKETAGKHEFVASESKSGSGSYFEECAVCGFFSGQ